MSPDVEVRLVGDERVLVAGGEVISSSGEVRAWRQIYGRREFPGTILVLGLGLGGVVRDLLLDGAVERLVVVERLPQVVALFRQRWPQVVEDPRLELVTGEYRDQTDAVRLEDGAVRLDISVRRAVSGGWWVLDDRGPVPVMSGGPDL